MKSSLKIIVVGAGYLGACVVASLVVSLYVAVTNGPDRQTYGGMYAFGDSILFLGVLAVATVPASGAALFFLRPYHTFWRMVAIGALGLATTGLAALGSYLVVRNTAPGSFFNTLAMFAPLRFFLTLPLALAF